ncbi:winged helix DNA-binding domain-containing protein [Solihabitans fulvus]|uniref:Winged helix DNA-binding domain-containing protein n=1 Tax=Solihabitans fulvus TaxID=1892852 RepID=A0A5B2XE23_9PSEU|nr:winged helix DNA-binding domain-containing protein [Solihabitans fulvus]KAA2261299.1 winged helix DNA-binding domain-containing protein [Solihabitans fulvus]
MSSTGDVLDRRALNRALLDRQLLLRRWELPALAAVERLAGLQSQAPNPPYFALWSRLVDFDQRELADLLRNREVVRIVLMRGTIHLVSAGDCRALRPVLQPMLDRGFTASYGRQTTGLDLAAVAAEGRTLVEEQPRTFGELGELLGPRWPDRDPSALAQAVRTRVPLVQVPPRGIWGEGGQATHTSAESWLGRPLDQEPGVESMVLRYLAAFGPATVRDVQVWSGLTRLRAVVDRLRPQLRVFRDEHGAELFDLPDAPRPDPETPAPVRFLSEFDNMLLSYADRTRILAEEHRPKLFTVNGIIRAAILVDGFVRGRWKILREGASATLVVEPFAALSTKDKSALTTEGARLLAFAAPEATHDIRFTAPL